MKQPSTIADPKKFEEYTKAGGPIPASGPIREGFWAGYNGETGVRMGVAGSAQRRAYLAGRERAKVERNLRP